MSSKLVSRGIFAGAIGASWLVAACGGGTAASAVRPKEMNAGDVIGGEGKPAQCHAPAAIAEPMVVDWKGSDRGSLEAAMGEGVAVVSYTCEGFKLLKGCKVGGTDKDSYRYAGISLKEDVVQLKNRDEVAANLPLSGATLSGEIGRGASIDIALLMVGRKSLAVDAVGRSDLTGPGCDGATHFIHAAMVGAFAMERGTSASVKAAAQLFGAGAKGASASDEHAVNRDGVPDDCRKATPDDKTPPAQCRSAITVELYPIVTDATKREAAGAEGKSDASAKIAVTPTCPQGMVLSGAKCTTPGAEQVHECTPGDRDGCKAMCEKGSAVSCYHLGRAYAEDKDAVTNTIKAGDAFTKACNGEKNYPRACTWAASLFWKMGRADPARALADRGCKDGDNESCGWLGSTLTRGSEFEKGFDLLRRACDLGSVSSCNAYATELTLGVKKRDKATAEALLVRGCNAGVAASCAWLGTFYGDGTYKKDPALSLEMNKKACSLGHASACARAEKASANEAKTSEVDTKAAGKKPLEKKPTEKKPTGKKPPRK